MKLSKPNGSSSKLVEQLDRPSLDSHLFILTSTYDRDPLFPESAYSPQYKELTR